MGKVLSISDRVKKSHLAADAAKQHSKSPSAHDREGLCIAMTKKGLACKNKAQTKNLFCYQHRNSWPEMFPQYRNNLNILRLVGLSSLMVVAWMLVEWVLGMYDLALNNALKVSSAYLVATFSVELLGRRGPLRAVLYGPSLILEFLFNVFSRNSLAKQFEWVLLAILVAVGVNAFELSWLGASILGISAASCGLFIQVFRWGLSLREEPSTAHSKGT